MDNEPLNFYGIIEITAVRNQDGDSRNEPQKIPDLLESHVRIVHYPDCQQLLIWLPEDGWTYKTFTITTEGSHEPIYQCPVNHLLNGSIKLVLDTLFIPEGNYVISIEHQNGSTHQIEFKKFPEGEFPTKAVSTKAPEAEEDSSPTLYKDGFGNEMPNEDLNLRAVALEHLYKTFTRRVEYRSFGRSGEVIYNEGDRKITFYMEMGGGDCVFYLDVPTAKDWEQRTGFSAEERDRILEFVASTTGRDQAPSCSYIVQQDAILYYRR